MSDVINRFLLPLDPRGFRFYTSTKPSEEEKRHPLLWRFWTKIPAKGQIAIFDRSWYRRAIIENIGNGKNRDFRRCLRGINSFERQLADSGYLIVKLFLHISKEKQQQRFEELEKSTADLLIVGEDEIDYATEYDNYLFTIEQVLKNTDMYHAPWTIIEANNRNFATIKVLTSVITAIEEKLKNVNYGTENVPTVDLTPPEKIPNLPSLKTSILAKADLTKKISKDEYSGQKKEYQDRLSSLQYEIFRKKIPVIILYEGWDASGKGGNIRRLAKKLNPRLYSVVPIGAPNDIEKNHHYLWRFAQELPMAGKISIFDRSWYGRVLVERVEELCLEAEWKRAYREINEFEAMFTEEKGVLIKFWMHIDKDTQLERFNRRAEVPHKQWKVTAEDWRNREKWEQYEKAVDDMLKKTSTTYAPWTIVESNDKLYSRIKTLKTVVEAVENQIEKR